MPLFKCSQCEVVENTALSNYWIKTPALCSQCDPEIAKWHEAFDRKPAKGMVICSDGFLYLPHELEEGGYFYERLQRGDLKVVEEA